MLTLTRRRALSVCLALLIPMTLGAAACDTWDVEVSMVEAGTTMKTTVHDAPGNFPVTVTIEIDNVVVATEVVNAPGGSVTYDVPANKEGSTWKVTYVDSSGNRTSNAGYVL